MPKEFDVTIVETLKMKVTVEAESLEEAEQLVSDGWYRGEYILDAECFEGVEFESAEPVIDLSYREMSDVFHHVNDKHNFCNFFSNQIQRAKQETSEILEN